MTNRAIIDIVRGITKQPSYSYDPGVYHSTSLGLISISSDGINWTTIADKNLGATQIYNDGDVLSESNCGKYFQRGNNYGFPWTGEVTTSSTQVATFNYGSYYNSNTFITIGSMFYNWDSSNNNNLWGQSVSYIRGKKGPCLEGFHVPSSADFSSLINIFSGVVGNGYIQRFHEAMVYLKMPLAGTYKYSDGTPEGVGNSCSYYLNTIVGTELPGLVTYNETSLFSIGGGGATSCVGRSIRPFKDYAAIPDAGWVTLYDGSSVAQGAGIFQNVDEGLISLSDDGETWLTIADKNLGATQVYNYGDTLSQANCGYSYQWGNNYGFPWNGTTTTSSITVDARKYGPYYNSETFITSGYDAWSLSNNDNLWGGIANTYESRRGPCSKGYHVPSASEITDLLSTTTDLGVGANVKTYLKMPFAGIRHSDSTPIWQGITGTYWTSDAMPSFDLVNARILLLSSGISTLDFDLCARGCSIRPFKNEPVIPDSTWIRLY